MKKYLSFITLFTSLFALNINAAGRLQNEDFKSFSQIQSSVLTTTGTLVGGNPCIVSIGSTTGLASGQFIYDTTNTTYIPSGTTIVAIPGTCSPGQVQMSQNATTSSVGDTIVFGGQMSQLLNDSKIYITGASLDAQLSTLLSNNNILNTASTTSPLFGTNLSISDYSVTSSFTNASAGTTNDYLVILNGSGQAETALTSSTSGVIGVAVSGAGTSGTVQVSQIGQVSCVFDNATTAGDYVQNSSTNAGECHDAGGSSPSNGDQIVGRVLSTNGSAGTYPIALSLGGGGSIATPVSITNGGTGQNSATAAFGALSPLSTKGDMITYSSSNVRHAVPGDYGNLIADSTQTDGWRSASYTENLQGKPGKNYIQYADFENNSTTGWTLGTIGTLTNGLPTGSPTFGSGASGNLSISTVSSSQIAGAYSLSYASSAATTQGNMVASSSYPIDSRDQAKVMTVQYFYSVPSGASNGNFSGSSSNSFSWAAYDITNSSWLSSAGNFCMIQNSGVGYCTGTVQTNSNTANIRFVLYNANASSGAITLYLDDFYFGPQTAPTGPSIGDWSTTTSFTYGGLGTVSNNNVETRRVGDSLEVRGSVTLGTPSASPVEIILPASYSINTAKISGSVNRDLGKIEFALNSSTAYPSTASGSYPVFFDGSTTSGVFLAQTSASDLFVKVNGSSSTAVSGNVMHFHFTVPITGWSSNNVQSSDTATNVVSTTAEQLVSQTISSGSPTAITWDTTIKDATGSLNNTTGIYTVPVSGWYQVNAALRFSNSQSWASGDGVYLLLYKNGSQNSYIAYLPIETTYAPTNGLFVIGNSGQVYCNAGDTLAVYGFQSTGSSKTTINATSGYSIVSFNRLSGPAVISATESVNANYYGASATIGSSDSLVTYTTKNFDSHNAYSSGTYTIPVSGKYQVTAGIRQTGTFVISNENHVDVYKNGSITLDRFDRTTGANLDITVTGLLNCNAGDTVQIKTNSGGTGVTVESDTNANVFSIARIGN